MPFSTYEALDDNKVDPPDDRHELFLLRDGEKKVTWKLDTRVPNTAIFTFNKEDHTLGNLLSKRLLMSPHIRFSGYIVQHPLVPTFDLRISTDGTRSPKEAIIEACKDVVKDLEMLSLNFTREFELKKITNAAKRQE